nr:CAP domain-containing protein [Rubeoparvulum massiliense]
MGSIACTEKLHADSVDTYTVKPGDTLWFIAKRYGVSFYDILAHNRQLTNPDNISPGDTITIPIYTTIQWTERQVVDLVNQERAKFGLPPLRHNPELARVARFKSSDMRDRHYFSHQSPTYGSPFQMMQAFRISFRSAGENIAAGQPTPNQVMQGWMNSPGHRQNILNGGFTEIGVGYVTGGSYGHYWTQMFIHP